MRSLFIAAAFALLAPACKSSADAAADAAAAPPEERADADASPTSASDAGVTEAGETPAAAPIGPDGGVVSSADGRARLTVPAGALPSEQPITITPAPAGGASAASGVYDFGPGGLSFAKDAEICLEVDGAMDTSKACLGYLAGGNKWVCEDVCLKKNGTTLCGSTHHFTNFAILLSGGNGADPKCDDALITSAGGTLTSPDGLAKLTVPAGALKEPTRITVLSSSVTSAELASPTFEFLRDGTTFAAKVELCIAPEPGLGLKTSCLGYLNADQKWVCQDTCLEQKGDGLCGTTDHFTNFAILLSGGKGTSCTTER